MHSHTHTHRHIESSPLLFSIFLPLLIFHPFVLDFFSVSSKLLFAKIWIYIHWTSQFPIAIICTGTRRRHTATKENSSTTFLLRINLFTHLQTPGTGSLSCKYYADNSNNNTNTWHSHDSVASSFSCEKQNTLPTFFFFLSNLIL